VLAGDLVLVPWAQDWRVPSPRELSAWRTSTGPGPVEYLRDNVLTEHGEHDWRAVRVGDLHLRSADGTLTRVPDTPAPRDCSPPSDVPGTSPTGTGTAPATPKPGRHWRRHTATPDLDRRSRPGHLRPGRLTKANPPAPTP
jgi:hypothetical protein